MMDHFVYWHSVHERKLANAASLRSLANGKEARPVVARGHFDSFCASDLDATSGISLESCKSGTCPRRLSSSKRSSIAFFFRMSKVGLIERIICSCKDVVAESSLTTC